MVAVIPAPLPELHGAFIDRAIKVLSADSRIIGVAAAGSYADDNMDEFSDVDLIIAVDPQHTTEVACVLIYKRWSTANKGPIEHRQAAETAALDYLATIETRYGLHS